MQHKHRVAKLLLHSRGNSVRFFPSQRRHLFSSHGNHATLASILAGFPGRHPREGLYSPVNDRQLL